MSLSSTAEGGGMLLLLTLPELLRVEASDMEASVEKLAFSATEASGSGEN